eukprot:15047346-Alexandrium_andersonii.AAC.1
MPDSEVSVGNRGTACFYPPRGRWPPGARGRTQLPDAPYDWRTKVATTGQMPRPPQKTGRSSAPNTN